MALFTNKKKKQAEAPKETKTPKAGKQISLGADLAHVLKHPRITEKATMHQSMSVYVFNVGVDVSKTQIAQAIEKYYKVRPQKVRVVTIPQKSTRNMRTGVAGMTKRGKKAYVYLKKGETITVT